MQRNFFQNFSSFFISLAIISCQSQNKQNISPRAGDTNIITNHATQNIIPIDTIVISARDLTQEYVANEVKADHDYKGKQLIVSGVISDIKKGIADDIYIVLQGSEIHRSVQCYYDDELDAQSLKKGMKVYFMGQCDGLWVNVIISNCKRVGEFIN